MSWTRGRHAAVAAVLLFLALAITVRNRNSQGDDLAASYLGCRVLAAGEPTHLYNHSATRFERVDDPVWTRLARDAGFHSELRFHPYVQTPLWAAVLRPLCTRFSFPAFNRVFLLLTMLSFAGLLWLTAYAWTPRLFHPGWLVFLCGCLYLTEPFKYEARLTQTHILFLFLTVASLVLAPKRPGLAGMLPAVAAAVKITPAFFFLYWLTAGRTRAAWSFLAASGVLVGLTLAAAGPVLLFSYLGELREVSNTLLVSANNQSLAAWVLGFGYGPAEIEAWHIHRLPGWMKLLGLLFSTAAALLGGWLDRSASGKGEDARQVAPALPSPAPLGALFALVGATVFTPIAWTHYLVLLLLPVMAMLDEYRRGRILVLPILVAVVFLLCLDPTGEHGVLRALPWFALIRREFYAALLSLGGLLLLHRARRQAWTTVGNRDTRPV